MTWIPSAASGDRRERLLSHPIVFYYCCNLRSGRERYSSTALNVREETMLERLNTPSVDVDTVANIAANSSLARVRWLERGIAPLGYIKGMAVMFAVVARKLAQGDRVALEMARASSGDSRH